MPKRPARPTFAALAAAAAIVIAIGAPPAVAAPLDWLFSTPHLATLTADHPISYRHVRTGVPANPGADLDKAITLERGEDGTQIVVTMDADGQKRPVSFRGMTGNPVLMVFLESVVRTISATTGANPLYLQNRIKDAMRERMTEETVTVDLDGEPVEAHRIELRPFRDDAHAAELGIFAGLDLAFVLSDAAPGSFLSLTASAPGTPAYSEEVTLDETH